MSVANNAEVRAKLPTNYRWIAVILIMGCISINYIDRVNLSVAVPTLREALNLSPADMGILMGAFFYAYILVQIPAGELLNRLGAKMVMGISCFLWGLATVATALVTGFWSFMIVRILLGLAEGPVFPASAQVVSLWVPKRERTLASCCFDCCARIGSAAAPPVVTWLIITYNWQVSFVVTGVIAIIYTFIWFAVYREPDRHPKLSKEEIAYIRQDEVVNESGKVVTTKPIPMFMLFTYKKTLLLFAGYFCYMYYWNMYISWMPAYLVEARGLDLKQMGVGAMIPYLCAIPCEICGGAFFDYLTRKGMDLSAVRRLGMTICLGGGALTLFFAVQTTAPIACVALLTLSMSIFSFGASNIWTIPNDIAPYGQAGSVGAAYSFCGQISGIVAPGVSGFLISAGLNSGNIVAGYDHAFYVMIIVTLLGIVFFVTNKYTRLVPRNAQTYTVEHL